MGRDLQCVNIVTSSFITHHEAGCHQYPPEHRSPLRNHKQETCDDSEEFCLRLKDGGELTLACSPDPPREGAGCRENGDNIQCFCSSNLCNSASGMGLTGFLLISMIALVVGSH